MADIKIEKSCNCVRTFTIRDVAGNPVNLGESTVAIRWRPDDAGGDVPVQRACTVVDAAVGAVSFTFAATEAWREKVDYLVKFIVTPPVNGGPDDGRYPDGYALTLRACRKV